jgi:hypothetical protein
MNTFEFMACNAFIYILSSSFLFFFFFFFFLCVCVRVLFYWIGKELFDSLKMAMQKIKIKIPHT